VHDDAMGHPARGKGMLGSSRLETPRACDVVDAASANVIAKANSPRRESLTRAGQLGAQFTFGRCRPG